MTESLSEERLCILPEHVAAEMMHWALRLMGDRKKVLAGHIGLNVLPHHYRFVHGCVVGQLARKAMGEKPAGVLCMSPSDLRAELLEMLWEEPCPFIRRFRMPESLGGARYGDLDRRGDRRMNIDHFTWCVAESIDAETKRNPIHEQLDSPQEGGS